MKAAALPPLDPDDLERLTCVYETARFTACLSRYDPRTESLAAVAVALYQQGVRDEIQLFQALIGSFKQNRFGTGAPCMSSIIQPGDLLRCRCWQDPHHS